MLLISCRYLLLCSAGCSALYRCTCAVKIMFNMVLMYSCCCRCHCCCCLCLGVQPFFLPNDIRHTLCYCVNLLKIFFDLPLCLSLCRSLCSLPLCLSVSISLSDPFLHLRLSFVAWIFSGECLDHMEDENMKLLTFPVKVEDGSVFLDLPPISELDQVHNCMLRSIRIYRVHVMLCLSCFQSVSFFFFEQVSFFSFFEQFSSLVLRPRSRFKANGLLKDFENTMMIIMKKNKKRKHTPPPRLPPPTNPTPSSHGRATTRSHGRCSNKNNTRYLKLVQFFASQKYSRGHGPTCTVRSDSFFRFRRVHREYLTPRIFYTESYIFHCFCLVHIQHLADIRRDRPYYMSHSCKPTQVQIPRRGRHRNRVKTPERRH